MVRLWLLCAPAHPFPNHTLAKARVARTTHALLCDLHVCPHWGRLKGLKNGFHRLPLLDYIGTRSDTHRHQGLSHEAKALDSTLNTLSTNTAYP